MSGCYRYHWCSAKCTLQESGFISGTACGGFIGAVDFGRKSTADAKRIFPGGAVGYCPLRLVERGAARSSRAGIATVFPITMGMASTFDDKLVEDVFTVVSDEARAKYHNAHREGRRGVRCEGLTFWTPNVNIFRDPRWGRGQETYGEDPYLTSRMGVAVVNGLQGPADAKYDKLHACAKHYAVHSGPEAKRHYFNAGEYFAPRFVGNLFAGL